ncbi:conserved hypothetical protein [Trichinella spiralis]|uniref:hypothetical protein n=1 Tax=Trichinella spiralis TaxID=6334 RepID=UPI0001EFD3E5|nr:conserved hypothetical protein [Trichinella spiralis]
MERLSQMEHACNHKDLEMSSSNTFCIRPKFYSLRWKLGRKSYEESLPEYKRHSHTVSHKNIRGSYCKSLSREYGKYPDKFNRPGLKSLYDNAYDHTKSQKNCCSGYSKFKSCADELY